MGKATHFSSMDVDGGEFSHDYGANRLLAARRARKRAEGDYQLLQNRLVRLRLEEEKAQKKISETKKKAQEILALKARNEMVMREKIEKAAEADNEIAHMRMRTNKQRQDQKHRTANSLGEVQQLKREGVLQTRKARQEHEIAIQKQRDRDLAHAQQCKQAIKAHEIGVQKQQHQKRIELTEKFQHEFDEKVFNEEKQRALAEAEVRRMEAEEAYLIDQLKATQESQRYAYDDLEKALNYEVGAGDLVN